MAPLAEPGYVWRSAVWGSLAHTIRAALAQKGLKAYATDIRRRLAANAGGLSVRDVRELCGAADLSGVAVDELRAPTACPPGESGRVLGEMTRHSGTRNGMRRSATTFRSTRACGREPSRRMGPGSMSMCCGGITRWSRRPAGRSSVCDRRASKRLGQWVDGDELDTRSSSTGRRPRTGRLLRAHLLKCVKDGREVAALLLVDISRSTANSVPDSGAAVLDVEKEAIVILCEALRALGDGFAVAGFSGAGRLGVDYFRIKGFEEPLSDEVKGRIGAVQPQRNTRMGAAIRHAGRELEETPARVRLLMVLSDGFPNDADYRRHYAVADTRKAVSELSARHIRFHALTVNLPADPRLDELYGKARHHVISEVTELPGRLLRVYSALTR